MQRKMDVAWDHVSLIYIITPDSIHEEKTLCQDARLKLVILGRILCPVSKEKNKRNSNSRHKFLNLI